MKKDIHPAYKTATVKCGCGNTFQTRSTREQINIEICSNCHPFYTGKQKLIDTAGMVERFTRKWGSAEARAEQAKSKNEKSDMKEPRRKLNAPVASTLQSLPPQKTAAPTPPPAPPSPAPKA